MKLGVMSFNTEYTLRADRLARAAEERGFESLWLPEHTHIPIPPDGVVRSPTGDELPVDYRHMADPFAGLSAAAAVTTRLRLGTCICLVNQHHPIVLAKQVATLDRLSDGRFLFGVGAGWNVPEMQNHGVEFADRWRQAVERVAALKAIWTQERASFSGRFVRFGPIWSYPKPVQTPHPPILLGTLDTPFGREQVARHADGWLPLTFKVERTRRSIEDVRARMRAHGREDSKLAVSLLFLEERDQTEAALMAAHELGVERAILRLPTEKDSVVLAHLDRHAGLVARLH
jgi:probable F420-dependent oxidoreductase